MNIIDSAKAFVQSLRELADRSTWQRRRCPHCGGTLTRKHGTYRRRPWFLEGRRTVFVQRHRCHTCRRTFAEPSALLVSGGWYAREVRRAAIDHWRHAGSSLRRTAEMFRSWLGRQERWLFWRPLDQAPPPGRRCYLSASTLHRWLDGAGRAAQASVSDQLAGVASSGQLATDGLWARLRGGAKRVVLALTDSQSGLVWPPVVVEGEEKERDWQGLFERAAQAGLDLDLILGLTSDGAQGLSGYLKRALVWVNQQRCVWHLWRSVGGELAARVAEAGLGLAEAGARAARRRQRQALVGLIRGVLDASAKAQARAALGSLRAHPAGVRLATILAEHWEAALAHLGAYNRGLVRVAPEWLWRDFRLGLGRAATTPRR